MQVKYGSFAQATSTGNYSVTDVGFQPKVVTFFGNHLTADGTTTGACQFFGAATSSSARCVVAGASADAAAISNCSKRYSNALCITIITAGGATPTVNAEANFVSLDSGGFTVNWTTVDATARIVNYIALGGTDLTNAIVKNFSTSASTGDVAYTGVGFKPDALIFFDDTATTVPTAAGSNASNMVNIGWTTGSSVNYSRAMFRQDAQATSNTCSWQVVTRCFTTVSGAGLLIRAATLKSFDTDGFTLNWATANTTVVQACYIALKGGQYKADAFNQNTSTGNQSITGVGFLPGGVIFQSQNLTTQTTKQDYSRFSLGVGVSSSERGSIWSGDLDNSADSVADSDLDRTKCLKCLTEGTPTLNTAMDFVSNDANGFTINNTTVDATSREILYFAFGNAAASTISSAANQSFEVNQAITAISTITITDGSPATITAANDIRIKIPATFNMTWATSDTTANIAGTDWDHTGAASSGAEVTVTYEDSNKTVVIPVTINFEAGDDITVYGLSFANFSAASSADNLELVTAGVGGATADEDDKTITVVSPVVTVASSVSQPPHVAVNTIDNVLGVASIVRNTGTGQVTAVTLKENGTILYNELTNVELWLSSDKTWDTNDTQLDTAKSLDSVNEECTFTQNFNVTTTTQYLIVRADVASGVTAGKTIEIQVKTISTTGTVSGTPLDITGTTTVTANWWSAGGNWSYRKKLTFNNIAQAENLTNFPVMVKLTTSSFTYSDAKADGTDLRFIDSDNSTELKYEIERWNSSGDSIIWVKIPQINGSSNTDFIYMYYGNASAPDVQDAPNTWSNGYVAVYHFDEQSGYYQDSAGTNHANTQQVTSRNNTDANGLGYYPQFVRVSQTVGDWVGIPDATALRFGTSAFTIMVRAKTTTTLTDSDLIRKGSTVTADPDSWWKLEWGDGVVNNRLNWEVRVNTAFNQSLYTYAPDGNWHNIWGTRDVAGATQKLYFDGSQVDSDPTQTGDVNPTTATNIGIGSKDTYDDDMYGGYLDEIRLSNVLRSADWISAQNKSMNDNFINVGSKIEAETIVSKYAEGSPTVPPGYVYTQSTGNCLGTFKFDGAGTVSKITLTEYGTCDAPNDLENVKLFKDDGDGNWESGADATQLGSTTTFSGASSTATFSGFSLVACSTGYVHVILDVKSTASHNSTVGIQITQVSDVTSTKSVTASSWPVRLNTSTIKDATPPEAVTTLSALTWTSQGEIKLSWTAPGDDGWNNDFDPGSEFDVRYSTTASESPAISTTTFANASSVSEFSPIPTPVTALWSYDMVVTGLTPGVTYYFAIKTRDEVPNWSGLSNGATTWAKQDTTPPGAITDLTGLCDSPTGNVTLSWSTPGDDGWSNTLPSGSKYRIDYSTYSIAWSTTTYDVEIPTNSVTPYTNVSRTITGLTGDTTYYFRIWTADEVPNWSGLSNGATVWVTPADVTAPAAITDLTGLCDSNTGNVTLYWSTPGDDGWTGTLPSGSKYRIDYSTYSIEWSTTTYDVEIPTHSVAPHTQVSYAITGLTGDTTWYFQIWTRDEIPANWSGLSNGATVWVNSILSVSISTDTYDFGQVPLAQSTHTVSIIAVTNDGNIKETYSLKISSVTLYDGGSSLWKSTDTTTGYNRFISYAIFHGTDVALGYFGTNDIVADENRSSTSERYTYENGSPPYKQTGVGVPVGEERRIWFRLDMPTSTTTGKKEKIKVTITAGPE
jgi:hypothetical protein